MDIGGLVLGLMALLAVGGLLLVTGAVNRWRSRVPRRGAARLLLALVPGALLLGLAGLLTTSLTAGSYSAEFLRDLATTCAEAHGGTASGPADVVGLDDGVTGSAPKAFFFYATTKVYVVDATGTDGSAWQCRIVVTPGTSTRTYEVIG